MTLGEGVVVLATRAVDVFKPMLVFRTAHSKAINGQTDTKKLPHRMSKHIILCIL